MIIPSPEFSLISINSTKASLRNQVEPLVGKSGFSAELLMPRLPWNAL